MNITTLIAEESPHRIRDHLDRKARYNPTKSLTDITRQLTLEYEDRFLVELLQNAYDAHLPGTTGGRVHVLLDESAPDGAVLYVANTGRPFLVENFDGLTNVAASSKPPGEGIGNKGVGFRSVLHVSESPEIYSRDPDDLDDPTFGGFCFGFATDGQIRAMVRDEAEFAIVQAEFNRYLLPVVATTDDHNLVEFRKLGMSTVIRVPLGSERAVEQARTQVQRLLEASRPIALFLDRLESIVVDHVGGDGVPHRAQVERVVETISSPEDGPILRWVATAGQRFFTTSRVISGVEIRAVVASAIAEDELDPSWDQWDADVEISIAVDPLAVESGDSAPALYTYLPMHTASPLQAHLHAPFHTKMARLSLNEVSTFNSFLLDAAADLAIDTLVVLTTGDGAGIDSASSRAIAADLLSWDEDHLDRLDEALDRRDLDLREVPFVPARSGEGWTWSNLADVRMWDGSTLEVLTTPAVAALAPLLDPDLGSDRIDRLMALCREAGAGSPVPSDDQVADWIELIAAGMEGASLRRWNLFLDDVARVFGSRDAKALQRRVFLLDSKRKLRRAGPPVPDQATVGEATLFLPPQSTPSDGLDRDGPSEPADVPKNLQRAITFLHEDIRLHSRAKGQPRTPVGELLSRSNLVQGFELRSILGHLERLLKGRVSDTTYRQALGWVYLQEQASRSLSTDVGSIGLHVPTAAGWVPADRAVFSAGWGTPRAAEVAALVKVAGATSATLAEVGNHTILDPDSWPFKVHDLHRFTHFLQRCGVRDGLFPVALRPGSGALRMNGNAYSPEAVARRFDLTDHEQWAQHIRETWFGVDEGPYTPYTGDRELWVVPGQDAFDELRGEAKRRLATALIESLGDWPDEALVYEFRRRSPQHRSRPSPQTWPSPARTFVERSPWFPMAGIRNREEPDFVPVAAGWSFSESGVETAPRFAPLAPRQCRMALTGSPRATTRLVDAGLKVWNSPTSASDRLAQIAAIIDSGEDLESEMLSVHRALVSAWSEVVSGGGGALEDLPLVVSKGSLTERLDPQPDEPVVVYVNDVAPGLAAQVLEAGGARVLIAGPGNGDAIAHLLADHPGVIVRRTSGVKAHVILDGEELAPSPATGHRLLDVFDPWLIKVVLAIIDIRSTRFARVTERVLHEAEARLRRIQLITGTRIRLSVDGETLDASGHLAQAVHIADPDWPLLVLNDADLAVPSWGALAALADDLAELVGRGPVAAEIRAAALSLEQLMPDWREPSDGELAKVLRCSADEVTHVLRGLRTSTDHRRLLLAPFIGVHGGDAALAAFDLRSTSDLDELHGLVVELLGSPVAERLFDAVARSDSIDEVRRVMGIDLGVLNTVLVSLGRPPVHFAMDHEVEVNGHVAENHDAIVSSLRLRHLDRFRAYGDLTQYASARNLAGIKPDPDWLHAYERPTEAMLIALVGQWLGEHGSEPVPVDRLESVSEVRAANKAMLADRLPRLGEIITAWCLRNDGSRPAPWSDVSLVREALGASGCLDFISLDEAGLIEWLRTLDLWPHAMPAVADLAELGLTEADLQRAVKSGEEATARDRRRRTEVEFDGETFDTATALGVEGLLIAVAGSVDDRLLTTSKTPTKLLVPEVGRGGRGRGRGEGSGGSGGAPRSYNRRKPTNEELAAIGLAGEVVAFKWLKSTYPETTDASWVSGNRRHQFIDHPGDDGLGFDFQVVQKSQTLLFEVKATTTDDYEFDLGTSEVRAAKLAKRGCYRLLFIRSIFDSPNRELFVLPNPIHPDEALAFSQVNQGIRLRFRPA